MALKPIFSMLAAFLLGCLSSNTFSGINLPLITPTLQQHFDYPTAPIVTVALSAQNARTDHQLERVAPFATYGEYCNATIIGEKQTWNVNHKKVLSYSAFMPSGSDTLPKWLKDGISIQAEMAKSYYPDWVVRLHTVGLSSTMEEQLLRQYDNIEIVRCKPMRSNAQMMLHRLLAADDPSVRITLVRDIDSRFSLRELMAVNEWVGEIADYDFHVMRDHSHHRWPVMGGTLGMKRDMFNRHNTTMLTQIEQALTEHPDKIEGYAGEDQAFLALYVWPLVKDRALAHDMRPRKKCEELGSKTCRDFSVNPLVRNTQGRPYFVGAQFKSNSRGMTEKICFDEKEKRTIATK